MKKKNVKQCDCDSAKKSYDQIISAQMLASVHGIQYTGDRFNYCPWCGEKLKEEDE